MKKFTEEEIAAWYAERAAWFAALASRVAEDEETK